MPIVVPLSQIVNPRALTVDVTDDSTQEPSVMQIFTGTVEFVFNSGLETSDTVRSFVPLDSSTLQGYADPPAPLFVTVVASLASLSPQPGGSPPTSILAVNTATFSLETRSDLPGVAGSRNLLILIGHVAVMFGGVGRMAYQVTVLTHQRDYPNRLSPLVIPNMPGTLTP